MDPWLTPVSAATSEHALERRGAAPLEAEAQLRDLQAARRQRPAARQHGRLRLGDRPPTRTGGRTSSTGSTATSRSRSTRATSGSSRSSTPTTGSRIQAIHQQALRHRRALRDDRADRPARRRGPLPRRPTARSSSTRPARPVRMRGTCIDITERVLAEQEREEHAARAQEEQTRRQAALEINDNGRPGPDRRALRPGGRRRRPVARLRAPHPRLGPRDHHRPGRPGRAATVAPGDLVRELTPRGSARTEPRRVSRTAAAAAARAPGRRRRRGC